ncbi:MAG: peptidyl-prolyl cis-trans isomerase, partial [Planctomycetes bacterium]|nr:peptidyl-prolyl cis-trans isomerase [Planctomycetota bacterium]
FRVRACVWLRRVHILADEHGGQDRARALAEEVVRDLRSGLKPAEVDVRHSLGCEQLTCSVDELEPRERDSGLRRDIKEWAFSSTVGAVSDPMELEPGNLAVFLVARKTEEAVRPFEEVQGEIEEQLGNQRRREVEKALLADLYRDANLEPPALRAWLLRTGPAPDVDREVIASILSKPL